VAVPIEKTDDMLLLGVLPYGEAASDVWIRQGRIAAILPAGRGSAAIAISRSPCRIVHADGLVMLPGLVDLHTHLREPGGEPSETIETGCRAAAAGGYTDVFAMANTTPVTDDVERVDFLLDRARQQEYSRVHPVGAITVGLLGREITPIDAMAAAGVTVFSDDGKCVDDAVLMHTALLAAARLGVVIAQHSQHGRLAANGQINEGCAATRTGLAPWPAVAEHTIVARDAVLAAATGGALHVCHVSTRGSVEIVRWAKDHGWNVTAEVTPHHLLLTDELAALADPRYKVNPPLRSAQDVAALREALTDGTIDAVATDHAPHDAASKARLWPDAPFGMIGLETALPVVAHILSEEAGSAGLVDWRKVASLMSEAPARIGGISRDAGLPLAVGESATFALVDTAYDWTVTVDRLRSKSINTPFLDMAFRHRVVATAICGRLTHDILS
jgi:dihydroorotase